MPGQKGEEPRKTPSTRKGKDGRDGEGDALGFAGGEGSARQEFERRTEARRLQPGDEESFKALRRGWCLGSESFKQQKLEELEGQVGQHHFGQLRLEVAQAKAERIIG